MLAALLRILDLNSSLGCAIASFKEPTLAKCTLIGFKSDLRLTILDGFKFINNYASSEEWRDLPEDE